MKEMIHVKGLLFGVLTLLFSVVIYAIVWIWLLSRRTAGLASNGVEIGLDLSALIYSPLFWLVAASGFAFGFVWMVRMKGFLPTPAGAVLGAAALLISTVAAIWVSGYFPSFAQNRGLLQLLVAIPLASLVF